MNFFWLLNILLKISSVSQIEDTHFFGSEEIRDSPVHTTELVEYSSVLMKGRRTSEEKSSVGHM